MRGALHRTDNAAEIVHRKTFFENECAGQINRSRAAHCQILENPTNFPLRLFKSSNNICEVQPAIFRFSARVRNRSNLPRRSNSKFFPLQVRRAERRRATKFDCAKPKRCARPASKCQLNSTGLPRST